MENDRPENPDARAAATRDLEAIWADARRRFELHRLEAESRFEADMETWRARADASERDAFDEQVRLARLDLKRGCDDVLEALSERHLADLGVAGGSPASIEDAIASLDELEAKCRASLADSARQLEALTEAMASIPDERERESTLDRIRSTLASSEADSKQLLADIARQRAELADSLQKNNAT